MSVDLSDGCVQNKNASAAIIKVSGEDSESCHNAASLVDERELTGARWPRAVMLTLRQLRYFVRIVETGSISKAAEQLRIAQTALGLQVRQIEQELGGKLFGRHSRGVIPTAGGRLLYERACQILNLTERAVQDVAQLQGRSATEIVTIGLMPSQIQLFGADLMVWTRKEMPSILFRLVEDFHPYDAIKRGEIDLAIGCEISDQPGIIHTPFLREELLFITAPPRRARPRGAGALAKSQVSVPHVLGHDMVLSAGRTELRQLVDDAAARHALSVRVAFEVRSTQAMKALVSRGAGATILPYGSVKEELLDGRLTGSRIAKPGFAWTLHMVLPERRRVPLLEDGRARLMQFVTRRLVAELGPLASGVDEVPDKVAHASGGSRSMVRRRKDVPTGLDG
jgi:LysR family nitrogen assimilation transcriptional regulator